MAARNGENYWHGHVEGWQQSGLTKRAYCARHGLSEKSFYRWQRKARASRTVPAERLTLVPVTVNEPLPGGRILLHSPGGWRIELPGMSAAGLAAMIRALP